MYFSFGRPTFRYESTHQLASSNHSRRFVPADTDVFFLRTTYLPLRINPPAGWFKPFSQVRTSRHRWIFFLRTTHQLLRDFPTNDHVAYFCNRFIPGKKSAAGTYREGPVLLIQSTISSAHPCFARHGHSRVGTW